MNSTDGTICGSGILESKQLAVKFVRHQPKLTQLDLSYPRESPIAFRLISKQRQLDIKFEGFYYSDYLSSYIIGNLIDETDAFEPK